MIIISAVAILAAGLYLVIFTSTDRSVLFSAMKTFEHNGQQRTYLQYQPDKPKGIVLALDGLGGSGRRIAYYAALHNVMTDYVVLYPDAIRSEQANVSHGWNAGFCCGSGWVNKVDDIGFIEELVHQVTQDNGLAPRAHIVGMSNGGMFAHHLAAALPETIASLSVMAGSAGANGRQVQPESGVSALLMHGHQDSVVPFDGGVGSTDQDFTWISFAQSVAIWASTNASNPESQVEDSPDSIYKAYSGQTVLHTKEYKHGGHTWPGWRSWQIWQQQPETSRTVADFVRSIDDRVVAEDKR